jgi:uncharacterized protein (UPF0303 family)
MSAYESLEIFFRETSVKYTNEETVGEKQKPIHIMRRVETKINFCYYHRHNNTLIWQIKENSIILEITLHSQMAFFIATTARPLMSQDWITRNSNSKKQIKGKNRLRGKKASIS